MTRINSLAGTGFSSLVRNISKKAFMNRNLSKRDFRKMVQCVEKWQTIDWFRPVNVLKAKTNDLYVLFAWIWRTGTHTLEVVVCIVTSYSPLQLGTLYACYLKGHKFELSSAVIRNAAPASLTCQMKALRTRWHLKWKYVEHFFFKVRGILLYFYDFVHCRIKRNVGLCLLLKGSYNWKNLLNFNWFFFGSRRQAR